MDFLLCLPHVLTYSGCSIFVSSRRYENICIIYIHQAYSLILQCQSGVSCFFWEGGFYFWLEIANISYLAMRATFVMLCVLVFVLAHTIKVASWILCLLCGVVIWTASGWEAQMHSPYDTTQMQRLKLNCAFESCFYRQKNTRTRKSGRGVSHTRIINFLLF